jgi:REase_DpnII-MboI
MRTVVLTARSADLHRRRPPHGRRFPLLTAELGNRHAGRPPFAVSDEYDVQDLLHGLLRLHFDDVRPEEWNPSYGGTQSRSDLLLKPERVVIET